MSSRWAIALCTLLVFLTACARPSEQAPSTSQTATDLPVAREENIPAQPEPEAPRLHSVPVEPANPSSPEVPAELPSEPMIPISTPPVAVPPREPEPEIPTSEPESPTPEPEPPAPQPEQEPEVPPLEPEVEPAPTVNSEPPRSLEFENQFAACDNQQGAFSRIIVKPISVSQWRFRGLSSIEAQARRDRAIQRFSEFPITETSYLSALDHYVFSISLLENQIEISRQLYSTGDYELVRRDCIYGPTVIPDDAQYVNQTYLPVIGAPDAWDVTTGSSSVTIAVLDSGVDATQEDLAGKVLPGFNTVTCAATAAAGCGVSDPVATVDDCRHHGTEVAAVAAAVGDNSIGMAGISFGARILPIRITNSANCTSTSAEIAEGIVWASEQGAQVINVSYAGVFDPTIQDASEQARRNGSLVVYAAGNNGMGGSVGGQDLYTLCSSYFGTTVCAAQTHPDVLVVGATDNTDATATFSNYGSLVDIVAPGVGIRTSQIGNTYVDVDGTSFSSPIVAGAAALVWSMNPSLTPGDVQHILQESALDLGAAGEDNVFGQGRLQLDEAVVMAQLQTPSTSFSDNAKLDFIIPKGPIKITTSDQVFRSGAGSRLIVFANENPGLISIESADISRRDLTLSELPSGANIGRSSLFYRRTDISNDFVFTDNSRTRVYLGSNNAFGSSGNEPAVVHSQSCGPFSEISDIHLTTTTTNQTLRLIVADKGANTLYSYELDPDGSSLCTNALSVSLPSPLWIRSVFGADPRIYVGYRPSGLNVRAFLNSDLSSIGAVQTITTSITARFGQPLLDTQNADLWVPIQFAYDSTGDDYVLRYDYAAYPPAAGTTPTFLTCPSPTQVLQDLEGGTRYTYFLCPLAKQVDIYDAAYQSLGRLNLPFTPRKMIVGSNGVSRYLSFLRSDTRASVYLTPVASPPDFAATHLTIPAVMDDIGTYGSLDQTVLVNGEQNTLTFIDSAAQALNLTMTMPKSVDHMSPQSSRTNHFVSSQTNSAYSLEELSNGVWKLRQFIVGTFPVQIGYRTSRLYTLNRNSNNLSVINLGTRSVTNLSLGTRPVHFDMSAADNRLWAVNETSQNLTTVNISIGSEAIVSTTALGFVPKKVKYQDSDDTLYVAGPTQVRSLDGTSLATVATQTISAGVTDIDLITNGVWATSRNGVSASAITRSAMTTTSLTGSPHLLSTNSSVGVAGMMGIRTLRNSAGQSAVVSAFSTLFSTLSYLFSYNLNSQRIYIFPYAQMNTTTFPSVSLPVLFDINRWASDSLGNVWTAQAEQMKLQRITSALQLENMSNLTNNRPQDIVANSTTNRVYTLARNLNALFVYDTVNDIMNAYSVCQSPSKILLDAGNSQIFILCQELNAISVVHIDTDGDPSSQSILTTALKPADMALNTTTNRLYVANRLSDSISVFNTTSLGTAPTIISVGETPSAITANPVTNRVHVFHENEEIWTIINGATNGVTETDIVSHGFMKADVNTSSAVPYAIAASPNVVYYGDATLTYPVSGTNRLTSESRPSDLALSSAVEKIYVTYDNADTVRVFDENANTATDVATGANPRRVAVSDTLNRVYISNFDDDTVTILNRTSNALVGTVSLTSGCGPMKATVVTSGGVSYLYVLCQLNDTIERFNTTSLVVQTPLSIRVQ